MGGAQSGGLPPRMGGRAGHADGGARRRRQKSARRARTAPPWTPRRAGSPRRRRNGAQVRQRENSRAAGSGGNPRATLEAAQGRALRGSGSDPPALRFPRAGARGGAPRRPPRDSQAERSKRAAAGAFMARLEFYAGPRSGDVARVG